LGFVTRIVSDNCLLATALGTAQELAEKPAGALQASKKLLKRSSRELAKKGPTPICRDSTSRPIGHEAAYCR
jgi:enoyl-CoA hydratase/carnithine racemase